MDRTRRRSVGFIERDGLSWASFLVTYRGEDLYWRGYFSFRPTDGEASEDEIRTADIFIESDEGEIDRKARGLGRPLLGGLLSSALHTLEQQRGSTPKLRSWFRQMLARHSADLLGGEEGRAPEAPGAPRPLAGEDVTLGELRSRYASYRIDQVAHFIALIEPHRFQDAVDTILEGRSIDFSAKDRLQFGMIVVEHIENRLPLPPFEAWVEDFLAHREAYALYAHTLHREGRLP